MFRIIVATVLVSLLEGPAWAARTDPSGFDLGFIASRHRDLNNEIHVKALGPFFEYAQSTQGMRMMAVRPFYNNIKDPANDRERHDYLWPIATSRSITNESQWRVLIFFGYNHDTGRQEKGRYRLWLFPFYFQGQDAEGVKYRAVFPLGGRIREFLGRDEISFVLFPAHSRSALNDLRTVNWVWPLISKTTTPDDHIYRARFFPFYGKSITEGHFEKKFVLWPIWNSVRYDYPGSSGSGYILFPLWGYMKLEDQRTVWVIPPLFRFTKGDKMNLVYCPWPFVQHAKSADFEKTYLWPFWGHRRMKDIDTTYVLWPLIWSEQGNRGDVSYDRFMFIPFYYAKDEWRNPAPTNGPPDIVNRYRKLWPVFSYRRQGDLSRLRFLELWPFPESPPVERNWAPFWTIYSRTARGDDRDVEVLWGLYRHRYRTWDADSGSLFPLYDWDRDEETGLRSWSLLKGLLGFSADDSHRQWRLLYLFKFRRNLESPP